MPSLSKKDKLRIKKSASKGSSPSFSGTVKGIAALTAGTPADVADLALSTVKDKFNNLLSNHLLQQV